MPVSEVWQNCVWKQVVLPVPRPAAREAPFQGKASSRQNKKQLHLKLKACSEGRPATKLGRLLDSQRGNNCCLHEDESAQRSPAGKATRRLQALPQHRAQGLRARVHRGSEGAVPFLSPPNASAPLGVVEKRLHSSHITRATPPTLFCVTLLFTGTSRDQRLH